MNDSERAAQRRRRQKYRATEHGKAQIAATHKKWLKTAAGRAYLKRSRAVANVKKSAEFKIFIEEQKRRPCVDCGGVFPPCVMDFDHVQGVKRFALSKAAGRGVRQWREEIAKCELVCANCHRLRTTIRRYGMV